MEGKEPLCGWATLIALLVVVIHAVPFAPYCTPIPLLSWHELHLATHLGCLDTLVYAQSEWFITIAVLRSKGIWILSFYFILFLQYWMEGKEAFVDVLHCTIRFLFIDQNTLFLALYRSNTGFIFLWLCHHSVTRWLARNTVWWEIFVRPGSALHFCVDNFHSSCCTS